MRRGTRVAQAYVALTVDGSGINDDINKELKDVDYGTAGRSAGGQFATGFQKEVQGNLESDLQESMDNIQKVFQNDKTISNGVRRQLRDAFTDGQLKPLLKNVGAVIGEQFGDGFDQTFTASVLDSLEDIMQKAARSGGRGTFSLGDGQGDTGFLLPSADLEKVVAAAQAAVAKAQAGIAKAEAENAAIADKFANKRVEIVQKANDAIAKSDEELLAKQKKQFDELARLHELEITKEIESRQKQQTAYLKGEERVQSEIQKMLALAHNNRVKFAQQNADVEERIALRAAKNAAKVGSIGDRIGVLLGAGSRNNFFNIIGRSIGGLVNVADSARKGVTALSTAFTEGFASAAASGNGLIQTVSGVQRMGGVAVEAISAAFAQLAVTGPAAVVAIVVVTAAMSALVSVASALLAIVTALTATIVSALTGALIVAGGLMTALAAATGLAVIAFTALTDQQKSLLKDAFQPLKAELTGIGQLMLQDMIPAFATWSANLQQALLLAAPVAAVAGQAFAEAGNAITAALSGPGFQMFSQTLARDLPAIVQGLSVALGGFLNGMLGLFSAVSPLVAQFSQHLGEVMTTFSQWATSAQGQNSIVDFATRAVDSLTSLWEFAKSFFGYISDVLFSPEAQDFGNSLFDNLSKSFDNLRENLSSRDLQKWFDDAREFGGQLWSVMQALNDTFTALYNSGVLTGVGTALEGIADAITVLNPVISVLVWALGSALPAAAAAMLAPFTLAANSLKMLGDTGAWVIDVLNKIPFVDIGKSTTALAGTGIAKANAAVAGIKGEHSGGTGTVASTPKFTIPQFVSSGNKALDLTSKSAGGNIPKWKNPYVKFANSLIAQGPSISAQIKNAILSVNKQVSEAVMDATRGSSADSVGATLDSAMNQMMTAAEQTVNTAQSALTTAAQSLANATTKSGAKSALKKVKQSQKNLSAAIRDQARITEAANILGAQEEVKPQNVTALLNGFTLANTTLAEYAAAREQIGDMITDANQKLTAAIALRDNYVQSITESTKTFAALTTAQAKTINGIEQDLTSTDITSNLQARLDKIRTFQSNLQILLARGLNNDAYKQLLDAGVDEGGKFAEALVQGGTNAVGMTNSLTDQIGQVSKDLGLQAGDRLYQAGVNAAQGLVDGLTSLSAELDSAATQLGNSIALAVQRALGIASPSKRLIAMMEHVGDGAVIGLDNQAGKVGRAAARFSSNIAVSPEVAAYAASQGGTAVSGNQKVGDVTLTVVTPTEDPVAVANETINALVGRL